MGYAGAHTVAELQEYGELIRVAATGLKEAHPPHPDDRRGAELLRARRALIPGWAEPAAWFPGSPAPAGAVCVGTDDMSGSSSACSLTVLTKGLVRQLLAADQVPDIFRTSCRES